MADADGAERLTLAALEVRVPVFPACAEPCGACFNGDDRLVVYVVELPVRAGEAVEAGQVVAVVETNKTTVEVPAPWAGRVAALAVRPGDEVFEDDLLLTLLA